MFTTIASLTLTGSILSSIATSLVLISFAAFRRHQLHNFRHVLILNLTVAEFVNSLNNSISGIIYLESGALQPGASCVANGFIGQLSVQASDFSILAIALVTLFTVTRKTYMPTASFRAKFIICGSVWLLPLITALIATILGEMKPVGGNWCWISATRTDLRYALTHGWRFFVIFSTIITYIFIWVYLKRNLISLESYGNNNPSFQQSPNGFQPGSRISGVRKEPGFNVMDDRDVELSDMSETKQEEVVHERPNISRRDSFTVEISMNEQDGQSATGDEDNLFDHDSEEEHPNMYAAHMRKTSIAQPSTLIKATAVFQPKGTTTSQTAPGRPSQTIASEFPMRHTSQQIHREIRKMMVLNAYPIMYVILWVPQLVSRLMEASGNKLPAQTAAALSISTQYVGLANALTYGFNHHLRERLAGTYLAPIITNMSRKLRWGVTRQQRKNRASRDGAQQI